MQRGADTEVATRAGFTPLCRVAQLGHAACVGLLLRHGADLMHTTGDGANCVALAARDGHDDTLKALLEAGVPVWRSSNGVILTAGVGGVVAPGFFVRDELRCGVLV